LVSHSNFLLSWQLLKMSSSMRFVMPSLTIIGFSPHPGGMVGLLEIKWWVGLRPLRGRTWNSVILAINI
jgi:hypothetical protein